MLMLSDARLPSVSAIAAGGPVKGSWWGHPSGQDIFRVASKLAEHPDVTAIKLLSGKVTYVHRSMWPAVVAAATSREPWQMRKLSRAARELLHQADEMGEMATIDANLCVPRASLLAAVRELESKLLIYAEEFHSESGAHAKRLESWSHWAERKGLPFPGMAQAEAQESLERAVAAINEEFGADGFLPWQKSVR